jgi:hypothetical protein
VPAAGRAPALVQKRSTRAGRTGWVQQRSVSLAVGVAASVLSSWIVPPSVTPCGHPKAKKFNYLVGAPRLERGTPVPADWRSDRGCASTRTASNYRHRRIMAQTEGGVAPTATTTLRLDGRKPRRAANRSLSWRERRSFARKPGEFGRPRGGVAFRPAL